jgi:histone-lysine N-methyltransferase SETMAR
MVDVRNFVARLAIAGKGFSEIKTITEAAYGDQALKKTQIYAIIKTVKEGGDVKDQRGGSREKQRTAKLIADVAADVSNDGRITVRELADTYGLSTQTVHKILHDDLGLSKKSARWVPKLLSKEQMEERVRISSTFVAAVHRHSLAWLDNIVTMDETMVSQHTPQTKKQSKRWVKKGPPGPIKAKVHASRFKHMVLAFFDAAGLIYTNIVPKGETVNAAYIVKVLGIFMKRMRQKRPRMVEQGFLFHWDNAPVHTAGVVGEWFAARNIQVLEHPPYSPDLAPADFFLFPHVKEKLAGLTIPADGVKKAWDGVTATISKEAFAAAFRRWFERCEKCIAIAGNYVEKS